MDAAALGRILSEARQARELSQADAALITHIREEIIQALESGDYASARLSPLQLRGMLHNYARLLRMDAEQVLVWFDAIHAAPGSVNLPNRQNAKFPWRWLAIILILILMLALGVLLLLGLVSRLNQPSPNEIQSTGGINPTATALPARTASLLMPPTSAPADESLTSDNEVSVAIEITQRGWLSIAVDGIPQYEGLAQFGQQFAYQAVDELRLDAGNAAGLLIRYRGETLTELGARGQRITLTIRADGIVSVAGPTASFSPTAPLYEASVNAADEIADEEFGALPDTETIETAADENGSEIAATIPARPSATASATITASPQSTPTAILPPRTPMGLTPVSSP